MKRTVCFLALLFLVLPLWARPIDLTKAVVVAPPGLSGPERKALTMLVEEVAERSWVRWTISETFPKDGRPAIVVGPVQRLATLAGNRSKRAGALKAGKAEGFRIWVEPGAAPVVYVAGNDSRGVLFGAGYLLRKLEIRRESVSLAEDIDVDTAPVTRLRGHQLGYRPKPNSYDGFTLEMWEQYIRDLAAFGTNAIELIPPTSDDDEDSPNFPLSKEATMIGISGIADAYGLDVWVWMPAMAQDYSDSKTATDELQKWGDLFGKLPRVDAIFVPAGDPGHTPPEVLMPFLEKATAVLKRHHPKAQMWMSIQSFDAARMDTFLTLLRKEPAWLAGIVYGPQTRMTLAQARAAIPARYPIRHYPDITHTIQSQYPVPDWDRAFVLTLGREPINPRPVDQQLIFEHTRKDAAFGFLTYSEGVNDDVNKIVWSALGWDPEANLQEILRDYGRLFIDADLAEPFAEGLFRLERNWRGPIEQNAEIDRTLAHFRQMEYRSPRVLRNWRFQQALYRAYYDAYVRERYRNEQFVQNAALQKLRQAGSVGSAEAMGQAAAVLQKPLVTARADSLKGRVHELAAMLFQSIYMQLSVPRYFGDSGRGNNLDTIEFSLNDARWLLAQFDEIRALPDEADRRARLAALVDWKNPGPGGFYDDLGNPSARPHLVVPVSYAQDPDLMAGVSHFVNAKPALPMAWRTAAMALYEAPLRTRYTGLDPDAAYRVRVVYAGSGAQTPRLSADGIEVHSYQNTWNRPLEFDIPREAIRDGTLTLEWNRTPGAGGSGRGNQVAEVWLIKKQ